MRRTGGIQEVGKDGSGSECGWLVGFGLGGAGSFGRFVGQRRAIRPATAAGEEATQSVKEEEVTLFSSFRKTSGLDSCWTAKHWRVILRSQDQVVNVVLAYLEGFPPPRNSASSPKASSSGVEKTNFPDIVPCRDALSGNGEGGKEREWETHFAQFD